IVAAQPVAKIAHSAGSRPVRDPRLAHSGKWVQAFRAAAPCLFRLTATVWRWLPGKAPDRWRQSTAVWPFNSGPFNAKPAHGERKPKAGRVSGPGAMGDDAAAGLCG